MHANESVLQSFLIVELLRGYRAHRFTPTEVIELALQRAEQAVQRHVWITRLPREQLLAYARAVEQRSIEELPLYGIPFVIKDNIDLAGVPTTAGCAEYSYVPTKSSAAVQRLLDAGAIPLGKSNLDQFATGLVGTRSPYGACRNSFNAEYISGGSSSGSAVAVATGLASFALGTDTAGSGRVPAAFNNIVGLKPSVGRISTRGVVPACRSLDCVSILALTTEDAATVLSVVEGFDSEDPYSRLVADASIDGRRFGVPRPDQLQFFGDQEYARLFDQAIARIDALGGSLIQIDFAPFLDAAQLLYEGPWIAERYAAVESFIHRHAGAMHPVTRQIIEAGKAPSAIDAFKAQYRLMSLKRSSEEVWGKVDVILTPTAGTIYEIARVDAEPIRTNSNLGYYTNFMNLLDLTGVAIPAGFRSDGQPFGVTIVGRRATDHALLALAGELHRAYVDRLGALNWAMPEPPNSSSATREGYIAVAVCGAHMDGLPLNRELRDRDGYLVRSTRTAAKYRLFALSGGPPRRPGLVRMNCGGTSIAVEVWAVRSAEFGSFVEGIPAPLGIGKIELRDGERVPGFVCESYAAEGAIDITEYGGWRAYLETVSG
jgi:allophanate hydrolase